LFGWRAVRFLKLTSLEPAALSGLATIALWVLRIYGLESGENLHNEELRDLYCLPSIIRMIKLRRMREAGHLA
jgi:hypothetical protein